MKSWLDLLYVLKHIDSKGFGGIPRSLSTIALTSMVQNGAGRPIALEILYEFSLWTIGRILILLHVHSLLIIRVLRIPSFIINWLISFLCYLKQGVKLARDASLNRVLFLVVDAYFQYD